MKSQTAARNVLAILTIMLWASAYVFTRAAVAYFAPLSVASLRFCFASLALIPYVLIKRIRPPKPRDFGWFIASGLSGFTLYMIFFNIGSATVTATVSSLIIGLAPIISAMLAIFAFKERMGRVKWIAFIIAFAGVAVICVGEGDFAVNAGIIWLLLGAFASAIYFLITKALLKRGCAPFQVTAYSIFIGTLFLLPFVPNAVPELIAASLGQILSIAYLGVFPAAIAYILWTFALSKAERIGDVTNYMFVTPVLTFFMGYWGLGEMPPATAFLGGALVMAGVIMTNLAKPPAEKGKSK